jgi:hypothetical protein
MTGTWNWKRWLPCLALALCGCARDELAVDFACDEVEVGDLVVTEIHANPDGSDGEGEYIELFNASRVSLMLDGLSLVSSRSDGTGMATHRLFGASIPAGGYLVLGNAPQESIPAHVDYSYADALGSLRNSNARLSIRCGERLIDEVAYVRASDGRAIELDGRFVPDHELNDEASRWCTTPAGVDEFSPGNFGTPGEANSPCAIEEIEGGCLEDGVRRALVSPGPGDLRIEEWMANPKGSDVEFEWVEVLFVAQADLNGLQLGPSSEGLKTVFDEASCFPVDAGARVVIGASPAAAPRVDAELRQSLGNAGARSIVAGAGGRVLDRVDYDETVEGVAWQVDPDGERCLAPAQDEYIAGNYGSPGESNPRCPVSLGPGMCFDGGAPREILNPGPAEAWISEWMANPQAAGSQRGEWVEVRFEVDADINGMSLSDLASDGGVIEQEDCLRARAGTQMLFARSLDPLENGGLQDVDAPLPISLNNSDETIVLRFGEVIVDTLSYERSKPGVATQVDELGETCDATQGYGDGDLGTPGAANPRCS